MRVLGVPNKRYSTGIGYVIVPADVDRDKFIIDCLRKEKVSIITQNGEYINGVYIDRDCIQRIEFPEKEGDTGSCVVFVNEYIHNQPIIVGVIAKGNENQLLNEHEFRLIKKTKTGIVSITGKADTSELFISVLSDNDEGGDLTIDLNNQSKSSTLKINVKGNIELNTTGKIIQNQGKEPIPRGSELKKQLETTNKLLDAIIGVINGATLTQAGGSPSILQSTLKGAISGKKIGVLDNMNSDQSFVK